MRYFFRTGILAGCAILLLLYACTSAKNTDMILKNGKIITVNDSFAIAQAVAVENDRIIAVGTNAEIDRLTRKNTKVIDLQGRSVIPGLIDAHLHPESASLSELDGEIPDLHSIADLLAWIKSQAEKINENEWIIHPKLFFTRLNDMRQPSLEELDDAAPENPVFLNGSFGGMINTRAMKISGIDEKTNHPGIIRDKDTGVTTGFIRASAFRMLKLPGKRTLTYDQELDALEEMLHRYNSLGITSLGVGSGDMRTIEVYRDLHEQNRLTVRIFQNILFSPGRENSLKELLDSLPSSGCSTGSGDEWVRTGALKLILDGGILTGTAYLSEPWGDKAAGIFGIEDKNYRGILNLSRDEVKMTVLSALKNNWKFTAHATGSGTVDMLLDIFEEANMTTPVKGKRFSIIHGNFFSADAISKMAELDIYADMQAAWFYKDADAMIQILGEERIRTFHPYNTMLKAGVKINGGSDHMVKLDASTSINPYNPFLAMWSMVTRTTEKGTVILPDEAISREDALRIYTINNAFASFEEDIKGSIEPGKLADMAVLSEDILTCPDSRIKDIVSELTITGGRIVYSSGKLVNE